MEERPKDLVRKPYVVNGECGLCSRPPCCSVIAGKALSLFTTVGETKIQRGETI